ncbi:MAG: hypothetical protein ACOCP8_04570 [archaeon]
MGKKIVYTSYNREDFSYRFRISRFVFDKNAIPINPFLNFGYYLSDTVKEEKIEKANLELIKKCDEVWIFKNSFLKDGVIEEMKYASKERIPIKFFQIKELQ